MIRLPTPMRAACLATAFGLALVSDVTREASRVLGRLV